jgi:hypothetical protein
MPKCECGGSTPLPKTRLGSPSRDKALRYRDEQGGPSNRPVKSGAEGDALPRIAGLLGVPAKLTLSQAAFTNA